VPLRVATLNCWNVMGPFDARAKLVRAGIAAIEPDVMGMQEIVVRRDGFDQAAIQLDGLGYDHVHGPALRWTEHDPCLPHDADEGDAFGNAIASRWPIRRHAVRALPGVETGERRSVLGAIVETPAGTLPFVTTHLNWRVDAGHVRERQVVAVADFVREWAAGADLPPVLVGDLNAEPDSTEIRFLCGLTSLGGRSVYFQDAWRVAGGGGPGRTWDNRNPFAALGHERDRRLDYVLVGTPDAASGRGWVESARLAFDEPVDGVFPSDHFGVVAEIRV